MTLREALRSERPFRRASYGFKSDEWLCARGYGYDFTAGDVLADDWEIKPAEPVMFESQVIQSPDTGVGKVLFPYREALRPFIGKRVRVTVEELP